MSILIKWIRKTGASLFFTGYFPFAPATAGSAITATAIWFASRAHPSFFGPPGASYYWIAAIAAVALSIWLSSDAEANFGSDDPGPVVCDEVAGQIITFMMVPITMPTLVLGFLLFRFFDIVKPFPVHHMEELPGGVGITMDDVLAGVYANISLLAIYHAYHFIRSFL